MMATCSVLVAIATRGTRIAAVGAERIHPPCLPLGRAWETARRLAYPMLDAVVAQTERSADWLRRHAGVRRVVVIPNAVQRPLPELAPSVPPEAWVRDHERVVLAVGRLDAQKGFDVLVRAFARVRGQRPGWRLVLVGDGPERAALQALAASLGVQDAVAMPGRVGNVGRWLGRADVYVLSSRFEGFPNTLVEAMDAGIACIATDCETGPREIVRDGEDGLLVPVDDPRAMADALLALTGDGRRRAELGERARAVAERFDEARIEARWMDVLGALVPAGGAR
jgi:glycosyltransferase involved in cell wall biosynthesis